MLQKSFNIFVKARRLQLWAKCCKTFYARNLRIFGNKLVFVFDKTFQPCLIFVGKAGAYLSSAPVKGTLLSLPNIIRLGWKGLSGTNTLAYYKHMKIEAVKGFITLPFGPTAKMYTIYQQFCQSFSSG